MNSMLQGLEYMFRDFGVNSFEDLIGLSIMMGIDLDKLQKYGEEHGTDSLPPLEDVMFDDDNPEGDLFRTLTRMAAHKMRLHRFRRPVLSS